MATESDPDFANIAEKSDQLGHLVKNPEFIKILQGIIEQPPDKREEFADRELDENSLIGKGIRPKGSVIKFKPENRKQGKPLKNTVGLDIAVPGVGLFVIRMQY